MAAAPRLKLADKQEIYKKVLSSLKKRYSSVSKLPELPVLETMLFAVCLENATAKDAEAVYKRLLSSFHDLNEVRVSSIEELEAVFQGMSTPDWRAMRIRGILGYVFESTYSFEYDGLKRKTLELATKQLSKIKELTPFVRDYTLQATLGAHVIPLDDVLFHAVEFLDLQAETGGLEPTSESLKPLVRKAEGKEFCGLLREFALDSKLRPTIETIRQAAADGCLLPASLVRFEKLLKGESIKFEPAPKKPPEKKESDKKDKASAKSEAGKKVEAAKASPAPVDVPKAEASKSKANANKTGPAAVEAAKPTPSKPAPAKVEKKVELVANDKGAHDKVAHEKGAKASSLKPTLKSEKPEAVKSSTGKSQTHVATAPKTDSSKTKSPVAVSKKEAPPVSKTELSKPKANGKSHTKNPSAKPASDTKPAPKGLVQQKSNKKPAGKSGK